MSKNIIEMINALNTEHKYAIADAVHNVDIPEEPKGDRWITMTVPQFKDYVENEFGWHAGKYEREIDGTTYSFGSASSYPIYTFPFETLAVENTMIKLIRDETVYSGQNIFMISHSGHLENGAPKGKTYSLSGSDSGRPIFITFSKTNGMFIDVQNIPKKVIDSVLFDKYTVHNRWDLVYEIAFNTMNGLSINNGINYKASATANLRSLAQITLGSTTLDESKLQALLALINQ